MLCSGTSIQSRATERRRAHAGLCHASSSIFFIRICCLLAIPVHCRAKRTRRGGTQATTVNSPVWSLGINSWCCGSTANVFRTSHGACSVHVMSACYSRSVLCCQLSSPPWRTCLSLTYASRFVRASTALNRLVCGPVYLIGDKDV